MRYLLFSIFALHLLGAGAQAVQVINEPMDMIVYLVNLKNTGYADVDGSPYAEEQFRPATIENETKTRFIRLNTADEVVEVKEEGKVMQLRLRENLHLQFTNGPKAEMIVKMHPDAEGRSKLMVFEKMKSVADHTLYLKERKKFIPKKAKEAFQESAKARFIDLPDTYYITDFKSNSPNLLELPRKKKAFMAFFGTHKNAVDTYIKKEKLDYKNTEDLVKILTFFFENRAS